MLVAGVQSRIGRSLQENLASARKLVLEARERGSTITCLPEYFSFPRIGELNHKIVEEVIQETISFLETVSAEVGSVVVGGTVPEPSENGYKNVCYVFDAGRKLARIEKEKVTAGERSLGIIQGAQKDIFKVDGVSATARICADILFPETCFGLRNKIEILFVPLISPFREFDPTRKKRDCLFITRAFDTNSYVVKTGAVGKAPLTGHVIAGRSLITSPNGILARSLSEIEEVILIEELDIEALASYDLIKEMFH